MWCVGCFRQRPWCRGREGIGPTCGKVAAVAIFEFVWYALQLTRCVGGAGGCGWCVWCVAHTWLGARDMDVRAAVDGSGWMVVKVEGVVLLTVWLGDKQGG